MFVWKCTHVAPQLPKPWQQGYKDYSRCHTLVIHCQLGQNIYMSADLSRIGKWQVSRIGKWVELAKRALPVRPEFVKTIVRVTRKCVTGWRWKDRPENPPIGFEATGHVDIIGKRSSLHGLYTPQDLSPSFGIRPELRSGSLSLVSTVPDCSRPSSAVSSRLSQYNLWSSSQLCRVTLFNIKHLTTLTRCSCTAFDRW